MSVSEIIGEIAALSPEELRKVIRFVHKLDEEWPLTPSELGALAQRLADCANEREAAAFKKNIAAGFYPNSS